MFVSGIFLETKDYVNGGPTFSNGGWGGGQQTQEIVVDKELMVADLCIWVFVSGIYLEK